MRPVWLPEWTRERERGVVHGIKDHSLHSGRVKTFCGLRFAHPAPAPLLTWKRAGIRCDGCTEKIRDTETRVPGWKR